MTVDVIAGWIPELPRIGTLEISNYHGKEIMSFSMDSEWLHSPNYGLFLDPDISSYEGRQFVPAGKPTFGFLSDASPDRWGRKLIQKQEMLDAEKESRPVRTMLESDYLLRISDRLRSGGLRFRNPQTGEYYSESEQEIPPLANIRQLEQASRGFELSSDEDEQKWLAQLLTPGSSLGGARPKANVRDTDGKLWIAKFPSKNDTYDVAAWEMVEHDLASECGLSVPDARLMKLSDHGSTFLSRRFDRICSLANRCLRRLLFDVRRFSISREDKDIVIVVNSGCHTPSG